MRIITVCRLYCTNVQYAAAVGTPRTSGGHCSSFPCGHRVVPANVASSKVMVMAAMHAKMRTPRHPKDGKARTALLCSAVLPAVPPLLCYHLYKKQFWWRCTRAPFLVCTARILWVFFWGDAPQLAPYVANLRGVPAWHVQ